MTGANSKRGDNMQILIFEIGNEKYAIETSAVQGIDKMMDITKVPRAPECIKGLVNLRGNIISVYDISIILGLSGRKTASENILIIKTDDEQLGIIVDRVVEVIEVDANLAKNISLPKEDDRNYIKGTMNMENYLVTLIDIGLLLKAA